MRVGLLECDHVAEHLKIENGSFQDMFQNLFPHLDFRIYDVCHNQFPESVDDCEVYMVTGSKFSVYDDVPWIYRLKAFVQEIYLHQKYYIGLCFGHQLLAEALGGKVEKSAGGWCVGVHSFRIILKEQWMEPGKDQLNFLMMCQDQVKQMPDNATLLASAQSCPVGMFKVGEKMLGIQAHPEFPVTYDLALMEARIEQIGAEKVKTGINSLSLPLDADIFAKWVMRFLR